MVDGPAEGQPTTLPPQPNWIRVWIRRNPKSIDALVYFIFLIVFTCIVFNAQGPPADSSPFHMINNIRLKWEEPFMSVQSASDWFDYMLDHFVPLMFPVRWYNGDLMATADMGWPGGQPEMYRTLGAVSVRQVRVQGGSCSVPSDLADLVPICYGPYSKSKEETQPFGPISDGTPIFTYRESRDTGLKSFRAQVGTYQGGGYQVLLSSEARNDTGTAARSTMLALRDGKWLDQQTRAVFVDFTLYNPALELLAVCKLGAEFPSSGGVLPRLYTRLIRLEHIFPRTWGVLALALEVILLLFIVVYMAVEVRLLYRMGVYQYFERFWGVYDWVNFSLFWAAFGCRFHSLVLASEIGLGVEGPVLVRLEAAAYYAVQWKNLLAFNAVLSWFKMLKYLNALPFMAHLIRVLETALPEALNFLGAIIFIYFGFALGYFLAYGDNLANYQTLSQSMLTLYEQVLGHFDVDELQQSNRLLGPGLFVLWTMLASVILFNVFVAIVIDSFDRVRGEVEKISFLTFLNHQALPPVQKALKKLQRLVASPYLLRAVRYSHRP